MRRSLFLGALGLVPVLVACESGTPATNAPWYGASAMVTDAIQGAPDAVPAPDAGSPAGMGGGMMMGGGEGMGMMGGGGMMMEGGGMMMGGGAMAADAMATDSMSGAPDAVEPADAASPGAGLPPGSPCTPDDTCAAGGSGTAACLADWPGGYCAVVGCADHGHDCPADPGQGGTATTGSKCVKAPEPSCLALCGADADCREGYVCAPRQDAAGHGSANVCVPG